MLMYMPLDANAQASAEQKDANAQGLGYPCFGFAGVPAQLVVAWAPGSPPTMYVVDASHYEFHWQRMYFHEQPIPFKANDLLSITCTYDSTGQTQVVKSGEETADEMCLNILYVSL